MAILIKGTTFSDGSQVTATNLNAHVDSATFDTGAVDNATTALSGGAIIVKSGGINTDQLADSGVTTLKLADTAVTTAKITDGAVTKAKIEDVADMKLLGNVSGSAAAPSEVSILDEDDMSSDSATAVPTQQSVKAYVDTAATFTPSTYAGEESITLPNGLIMKIGRIASSAGGTGNVNVTFAEAFPTAIICVSLTVEDVSNGLAGNEFNVGSTYGTSGFNIRHDTRLTTSDYFHWVAYGY